MRIVCRTAASAACNGAGPVSTAVDCRAARFRKPSWCFFPCDDRVDETRPRSDSWLWAISKPCAGSCRTLGQGCAVKAADLCMSNVTGQRAVHRHAEFTHKLPQIIPDDIGILVDIKRFQTQPVLASLAIRSKLGSRRRATPSKFGPNTVLKIHAAPKTQGIASAQERKFVQGQ